MLPTWYSVNTLCRQDDRGTGRHNKACLNEAFEKTRKLPSTLQHHGYYKSLTLLQKGWNSSNTWEKNLANQNSIQEEIKSRLKSGNACYHSVQNILSSGLLSKNVKIKIYRTVILRVFFMGVKLGRSH
jgi:hypothetical protein